MVKMLKKVTPWSTGSAYLVAPVGLFSYCQRDESTLVTAGGTKVRYTITVRLLINYVKRNVKATGQILTERVE